MKNKEHRSLIHSNRFFKATKCQNEKDLTPNISPPHLAPSNLCRITNSMSTFSVHKEAQSSAFIFGFPNLQLFITMLIHAFIDCDISFCLPEVQVMITMLLVTRPICWFLQLYQQLHKLPPEVQPSIIVVMLLSHIHNLLTQKHYFLLLSHYISQQQHHPELPEGQHQTDV